MKEKINHFSKGDFQLKKPDIVFAETNLLLRIREGEVYNGHFTIENQSDGDIRGLVYSSSFRMLCDNPGFQGNPVTVEFQYDGQGLKPGFVEKGEFIIICNGGEYTIQFTAIIEKPFVMTSQGKIQNLHGFKKLAYDNFEEAIKIFRSREFYELIKYDQPKYKNLYNNMRKWSLNSQGMEEFLVGIKQKEKIFLTLASPNRIYKNIDGKYKDSLEIHKNTWGYLGFSIRTDCEFIELPITKFTTLDFENLKYVLQYTISNTKLHVGRNFGNIIIESPFEKYVYAIEIDNTSINHEDKRQEEYIKAYLIKSLLRLENGALGLEKWQEKSYKLINELQVMDPNNQEYKLYQAHVYIMAHKYDEAKWILDNYHYSKFAVGRDVEVDAYYLFLSALQKKETVYTKKVVEELQRLYLKNPKSWKILYMMVQIDSYYNDNYEKKHALENQFNLGANHILIYLEAYKCFRDKPVNLKKITNFEIQILRFAIKYKLMTKELALYVANLAAQHKINDPRVIEILEKSYDIFPEYMILQSICTILIRLNDTDKKNFKWYDLAIKEELKLAKIYEYYMETVDCNRKEPLPRTLLLYFAHGNSLSYEKAALLYANIVMYENATSELYSYYKDVIKVFVMQQLEMRRINQNLRVLYDKFLSTQEMNIEKIKAIYDITHSYIITTKVPNINYVLVISSDGGIYQRVPYTDQGSQVILDSKDDIIVWESDTGAYFIGSVKYKIERLFYETKYIDMCKKHMDQILPPLNQDKPIELSYESLLKYGVSQFLTEKTLVVCEKELRELEMAANANMIHILFELFQNEIYNKTTLEYLTYYYTGSIRNMKEIWYAAYDYEVKVSELSVKIISQMLFTETMIGEKDIFTDCYMNSSFLEVEEAYMAYVCREYLVKGKIISDEIVEIIMEHLERKFDVADVIKIAVLKYYSSKVVAVEQKDLLKLCMQELCEKQIYFDFYMNYNKELLREVQLWDKTLVSYTAKMGGTVKLVYQLQTDFEHKAEFETEVLLPVFESIYVKKFTLFTNEILSFYFKETLGDTTIDSKVCEFRLDDRHHFVGKYGRLNDIIINSNMRDEMMTNYALEESLASKMFVPY